jgi:hypothetical protein
MVEAKMAQFQAEDYNNDTRGLGIKTDWK